MSLFRVAFGLIRFFLRLVLVLTLAGAITLAVYTVFWLPDVRTLIEEPPETTAFIERARARIRKEGLPVKIERTWVPLDHISKELVEAVLVAEDDRFYDHKGFDLIEIRNSMMENIRAGRWERGGSTITQQLAKNLYLSPDKTLRRKFDEMILTWSLETHLSKSRILELYLNYVDWGEGRFGAEEAARFYFSKPASKITRTEAASLAARLPNPDVLSSGSGEDRRKRRETMILSRMKKHGSREIPEEPPMVVASKPQVSSQGPLLPAAATLLPNITGPAAQVGTLFKDKVSQALTQLESMDPLPRREDPPEEPPRPIQEHPSKPDTVALVSSTDKAPMDGQLLTAPKESTSSGDPSLNPTRQEVVNTTRPAIPRPVVTGSSGTASKVNAPPKQSSPSRSKRLKESLARLEQTLGK